MPARDRGESDLELIERAVREAGGIARRFFGGDYKRWSKKRGEPVTEADLAVDRFLRETLEAARPDYGWLSEETGAHPGRLPSDRYFIVDPIDGTTAFMKGRPHFSISVAVAESSHSIAGAVYNPILDEMFAAGLGQHTLLNGAPVGVHDCDAIEGCRMLAAQTMLTDPRWSVPPNTPWPQMQIETRSSIAYRMALVAAGTFDAAVFFTPKHDWDVAAADIIVREAGGLVTTMEGDPLSYGSLATVQRSMICAGPRLHALLLDKVRHADLRQDTP
ncbi:MAG TPA: 3'(2'),5'-bisphosphate nucleotidase CysQ [Rhizomicrobium sp.]